MDEKVYLWAITVRFDAGEYGNEGIFYIDGKTEDEVRKELREISKSGVWTFDDNDDGMYIPGHRIYYMKSRIVD